MSALERIQGQERIQQTFGRWPAFHDCEILEIALDRNGPDLTIHLITPPTGGAGVPDLVIFRFHDIDDLALADFNHQNVIAAMTFSERVQRRTSRDAVENRLIVDVESIFGVRVSFSCRDAEVIAVSRTASTRGNSGIP